MVAMLVPVVKVWNEAAENNNGFSLCSIVMSSIIILYTTALKRYFWDPFR